MVRGKPALVSFYLTDPISGERVELKTLESDPHKFLGCVMTLNNSPEDHLKFLKEKLNNKLVNIDKTKVRAEYKMAVYTRYALPSLRYHLTVHSLHKCHLEELDLLAKKFLKKWLGVPARGATSEGIFSPLLLGVKPVSQTYLEGHISAYINSILVADKDTKEALKCAEEREGQWTRKSSTIMQCKQIVKEMTEEDECTFPTPENCATFPVTVRIEKPKIMRVAKERVAKIFASKSAEAANAAPFQGEMLRLLQEEGQDISWKATIHRVPRGVIWLSPCERGQTLWQLRTTYRGGGDRSTNPALWRGATQPVLLDTCSVHVPSPWTGLPFATTPSSPTCSTPSCRRRRRALRCLLTSMAGG